MTRFILLSFFLVFSFTSNTAKADCVNPAGIEGDQVYNSTHKTMQFCDGTNWFSMKGGHITETDPKIGTLTEGKWCTVSGGKVVCTSDSPSGGGGASDCVLIGQTCNDGSILAGQINHNAFYVTSADQSANIQWSTNTTSDPGSVSTVDGKANQAWIVANRTLSEYPAFQFCENLNLHGKSDWYLPAQDELNVLYQNRSVIGGFSTDYYWSSTQFSGFLVYVQYFSNGSQLSHGVLNNYSLRCIRRD